MTAHTHCSHGKRYEDECLKCELVYQYDLVARWQPAIDRAKKKIVELSIRITEQENETQNN